MITSGYTMELNCDCDKCKSTDNHHNIARGEFVGESYAECAKQARAEGWVLSRDKVYCSAPNHSKFARD